MIIGCSEQYAHGRMKETAQINKLDNKSENCQDGRKKTAKSKNT